MFIVTEYAALKKWVTSYDMFLTSELVWYFVGPNYLQKLSADDANT